MRSVGRDLMESGVNQGGREPSGKPEGSGNLAGELYIAVRKKNFSRT